DGHARSRDRTDRVHRDAVPAEVARRHLREPADPRLGGAVVGLPGIAEEPRARAERDDAPGALLAHRRAGVTDAVERPLQVHREDGVPLLLAHVEDHAVAQDAGAGDQHVEATEALERRGDDPPRRLPAAARLRPPYPL